MKWNIEYKNDDKVISTVVSGNINLEEIKLISAEVFQLASKKCITKLISDFSSVTLDISTIEIHQLPQTLTELGRISSIKSAIVYSANSPDKSSYIFFDNRCFNNSINTKIFTDYSDAYQWLMQ